MSATIIAAAAGRLVEQVGSYAGYASVVGLGVLALLYFTQAREVKRLREWAGRAPERDAELAQRVQADAQRRVVAQPLQPMTAAAQQSAEARAQAATAAVYASIGAPPPGAPAPGAPPPPGQLARPLTPGPAPATGSAPAAPAPGTLPVAPAPAASAVTQIPAPAPAPAPTPTPAPTPNPSPTSRPMVTATPTVTPPAATAATAAARVAAQSRTIPVPGNGSTSQDTAESAAARPEPLPPPPGPPPSQFAPSDDEDGFRFGFPPARVAMIVGGAIATVLVAVVLMLVLTGDEETAPPPNGFGNTPSVEDSPSGAAAGADETGSGSSTALTSAQRRATDIAVLNGTTQTGLARAVANKIQEDGYSIVGVDTNADQSVPTTVVSYNGDHERAALAVARIMGVDRGSVQAADANTTAAATADVTVIVGSDQIE